MESNEAFFSSQDCELQRVWVLWDRFQKHHLTKAYNHIQNLHSRSDFMLSLAPSSCSLLHAHVGIAGLPL